MTRIFYSIGTARVRVESPGDPVPYAQFMELGQFRAWIFGWIARDLNFQVTIDP